jgi:hypothetical protein
MFSKPSVLRNNKRKKPIKPNHDITRSSAISGFARKKLHNSYTHQKIGQSIFRLNLFFGCSFKNFLNWTFFLQKAPTPIGSRIL